MGRKAKPRRDYVKDSQSVYRIRTAIRDDAELDTASKLAAMDVASQFMTALMALDSKKGKANVERQG